MNKTVCNSIHDFLNLKFFSKYGTMMLILIIVFIVANLMDLSFNLNLERFNSPASGKIENFTTYSFPDLFYLKQDISSTTDNKYVYIFPICRYTSERILTNEMKSRPYRVFVNSTNSNLRIRIPVLTRELLTIFGNANIVLNSENRSRLVSNGYIELEFTNITDEGGTIIQGITDMYKDRSFNLKLVAPAPNGSASYYLTLETGNVIGFVSSTSTTITQHTGTDSDDIHSRLNRKGRFMIKRKTEVENERFNPIIPGTIKLKIHPNNNELDIMFNVDPNQKEIDHFLIILAKYDYKRNLVGHLKVHTSVKSESSKKNICYMDAGIRKCTYTLTDIDHIDENGHILYYRLGIIPINIAGTSGLYVEPTYPGGYTHFVMSKSEKEMERVIRKVKEMEKTEKQRDRLNEQIISSAGGEYEFLKKQLGNYPNSLILDTKHNTLEELANKSMALGEINLDISNL